MNILNPSVRECIDIFMNSRAAPRVFGRSFNKIKLKSSMFDIVRRIKMMMAAIHGLLQYSSD